MVSIGQDMPQEFLEANRRRRLAEAVAELIHERGDSSFTAGDVISRARVSRNTFYDLFSDRKDCGRFACEEATRRIFGPVWASLGSNREWPEGLHDAIGALLEAVVAEPAFADLCLVHSMALDGGGPGSCQEAGVAAILAVLAEGREAGLEALGHEYREPPPEGEELIASSILAVVGLRIRREQFASFQTLHGELVTLAAIPFVGMPLAERYGRHLRAA